jgi:hypothetical protein
MTVCDGPGAIWISVHGGELAARAAPQLILIDGETYATTFEMRSPLDRDKISLILSDIVASRPRAVLIDLQLEPAFGELPDRPLDRLLLAAVSASADVHSAMSAATRVILPLPERRTPSLDRVALGWMQTLCQGGVEFGSAQIRSHFGAVVRVDEDRMSMASLARASLHPPEGDHGAAQPVKALAIPVSLCALAEQAGTLTALWQLIDDPTRDAPTSTPLSPSAVRAVDQAAMVWRPDATRLALLARPAEVVVLGGSFDDRDRFLTHAVDAPLPGAVIHAAAAVGGGRIRSWHSLGWTFDVVVGVGLGFFFQAIWRLASSPKPPEKPSWNYLWASWASLAIATSIWVVAIAIALGLMLSAGALIEAGLWLNPGPVVIGMFLHALLLKNAASAHGSPRDLSEFTVAHPAWPLQFLISAWALYTLVTHASPH